MRQVKISGTGMFVPPQVVTNKDLEALMDTSDEWIQQRSGIKQRHHVEEGVGPSDLALEASRKALEAAGLEAKDLDMVIVASLSPDYYFPGVSCFLQDKLGLSTTPSMDIRCQCTGFIYALNVGQLFVASGQYNRVLVCGAEVHSSALNMTTEGRDVAVLFGDGAGAVVLEAEEKEDRGILATHLFSQGEHRDLLKIQLPGTLRKPYVPKDIHDGVDFYPSMDGRNVFKNAITRIPEAIRAALGQKGIAPEEVDVFLIHQANLRIVEATMKILGQPLEKSYNNIDRYGNCSAASVPILLDECVRSGRIKEGSVVCMAAFGAGFTWGSSVVRW